MQGRHGEYTVEVRRVENADAGILYVLAGRSGPAYQYMRDGDGDGVVCE